MPNLRHYCYLPSGAIVPLCWMLCFTQYSFTYNISVPNSAITRHYCDAPEKTDRTIFRQWNSLPFIELSSVYFYFLYSCKYQFISGLFIVLAETKRPPWAYDYYTNLIRSEQLYYYWAATLLRVCLIAALFTQQRCALLLKQKRKLNAFCGVYLSDYISSNLTFLSETKRKSVGH